jgi:hypothetical protein
MLVPVAGLGNVWNQAILFHLKAAGLSRATTVENWQILQRAWPSASCQWLIGGLAALSAFGGWRALAALLWWVCTLTGLLYQRPLFAHHLLALVPAAALAAALGWRQLVFWARDIWRKDTVPTRIAALGAGVACLALTAFLAVQLGEGVRDYRNSASSAFLKSIIADRSVAEELHALTAPSDFVLTDAQGIVFLARRDVPPGLTDTSFKRIGAGYLSSRQVIDQSERYSVQAALLWTGRLSQMPEVCAWAREHFSRHRSFDGGRVLWFSPK